MGGHPAETESLASHVSVRGSTNAERFDQSFDERIVISEIAGRIRRAPLVRETFAPIAAAFWITDGPGE
jgi:hypothetical protein